MLLRDDYILNISINTSLYQALGLNIKDINKSKVGACLQVIHGLEGKEERYTDYYSQLW